MAVVSRLNLEGRDDGSVRRTVSVSVRCCGTHGSGRAGRFWPGNAPDTTHADNKQPDDNQPSNRADFHNGTQTDSTHTDNTQPDQHAAGKKQADNKHKHKHKHKHNTPSGDAAASSSTHPPPPLESRKAKAVY